jgi:MYXO-CTERM domain-containing protein
MIGASLEMLDASGAPRLRVDRPYGVDANGERFDVELALAGCDADRDPAPPFGRAVVAPGSRACAVTLRWSEDVAYPVVIDPAWTSAGDLAANNVSYEMHLAKNTGGRVLAVLNGNVAQLWDAAAGTWANTGAPTFAFAHRTRLVPTSGNKAFAINTSGVASIFDVGTGTWKASAATPTVDGNGVAAVDEGAGKVLVFDAIGRAYEYDVASDQYTAKTSAGRTIGGNLGVFKLTGTTLGFTGFGTNRVAIYDYATDKWAFPASNVLTGGAENCGNLELLTSGKVLAYGACGGANQANVFDPLADGVVPVPMPSTPSIYCQCGHTTSISYAKLHVIAGGRYVFDEDTGAITDSGAFASGAAHHGAVVKLDDGRALAAGGSVTYDNKATDVYGPSEAADCGAGSRFGGAAAPVFDATSKTCKACDGDNGGATPAKCPTAGRPLCRTTVTDPLRGQCTACSETSKALCTGTKPLCNTATGSCTGCAAGFGVADASQACPSAAAPVCRADGACAVANGDFGTSAGQPCPTAAKPWAKADGTCGACAGNADCAGATHAGPICNTASGTCGTACAGDADCGAGKYCDLAGTPAVCAAKKDTGGACASASECVSGACTGGTCEPSCRTTADCAAGTYCDRAARLCKAKRESGQPCTSEDQCTDGACSSGVCGKATSGSTSSGGASADAGAAGGPAAPAGDGGGCSVAAGGAGRASGPALFALLGLLGLAVRRRTERPSRLSSMLV